MLSDMHMGKRFLQAKFLSMKVNIVFFFVRNSLPETCIIRLLCTIPEIFIVFSAYISTFYYSLPSCIAVFTFSLL